MATYNGAKYIESQLASLAAQSLLPRELIVTDDGSSDATLALVHRFAKAAPFPVRIQENSVRLGYADNFLLAARQCRSDYIAFCDQDDHWASNKLAMCCKALEQENTLMVTHAVALIDSAGARIGHYSQGIWRDRRARAHDYPPWHSFLGMSQVFQASLLDTLPCDVVARGLNPDTGQRPLGHDQWVAFIAGHFGEIVTLSTVLADYRLHGSNASMSNDGLKKWTVQASRWSGMPAAQSLRRGEIAQFRSQVLANAAKASLRRDVIPLLSQSSQIWAQIAHIEDQRLAMYAGRNLATRCISLARLLMSGGYQIVGKGWGACALAAKDFLVGTLRLRRVKI